MPKKPEKLFSQELIKIFSKAADNKIYGSVEVFFEAGSITQITQRIISKLVKHEKKPFSQNQQNKAYGTLKNNHSQSRKIDESNLPVTRTP